MVRTCGKPISDFTLGSQLSLFSASGEFFSLGFCFTHRSACTSSSGYVEAMSTCARSESGYSAMGATTCSSSSGLSSGDAGRVVAGPVDGTAPAGGRADAAPVAGRVVPTAFWPPSGLAWPAATPAMTATHTAPMHVVYRGVVICHRPPQLLSQ